ncbi:MAG: sodium:proton antiporter NhaD [Granulosicoccaceae bacterium]
MNSLILILIALGFVSIVAEDLTHLNKAKTTLFFGSLVWVLHFVDRQGQGQALHLALNENLQEIASLWLFLMAAMTFVAYLNNREFFSTIASRLLPSKLSKRALMLLSAHFAFVFSSLADNVTATLVCFSILIPLKLNVRDMARFAAVIVFAVNSGGVALITGDVTTLMVFTEGKVDIPHLLVLVVPAYIALLALTLVISRGLDETVDVVKSNRRIPKSDWFSGALFLLTIGSILYLNVVFDVPPLLTYLLALSVLFLIMQFINGDEDMMRNIRLIEFDALFFFLGILLMVGMLKELHVLRYFAQLFDLMPVWAANYCLGVFSAVLDNVPLTAAILQAEVPMSQGDWVALVYAVGVGGSLLVVGSAAGVIAMSRVEGLSFLSFARYSPHLLVAYSLGYALAYWSGTWLK